jgi:hypothetical protein
MNDSRGSVSDTKRSRLRVTIAAIERELARLPPDVANDKATVCGHCWTRLTPPASPESLAV